MCLCVCVSGLDVCLCVCVSGLDVCLCGRSVFLPGPQCAVPLPIGGNRWSQWPISSPHLPQFLMCLYKQL